MEERVFLESSGPASRIIAPDAFINQQRRKTGNSTVAASTSTSVAQPRLYVKDLERTTEGYIEIVDRHGGKVVTVIEFLKPGQ